MGPSGLLLDSYWVVVDSSKVLMDLFGVLLDSYWVLMDS